MKFATVNGNRAEAQPKLRGSCEECQRDMIAHCGQKRIWHWKHYRKSPYCWHENETPWHRAWKECFPAEWQEDIHKDTDGEIHKADVKTANGHVIEFQYSRIDPEERKKREEFYKNMAWVVNGTRLLGDYVRFKNHLKLLKKFKNVDLFSTSSPEKLFNRDWLDSKVPVFFDFERDKNNDEVDPLDQVRTGLHCLLPGRARGQAVILRYSRTRFIGSSQNSSILHFAQTTMNEVSKALQHGVELRYGKNPREGVGI